MKTRPSEGECLAKRTQPHKKTLRHRYKEKFTSELLPCPEKLPPVAPDVAHRPFKIVSIDHTNIDPSLLIRRNKATMGPHTPKFKAIIERYWRETIRRSPEFLNFPPWKAAVTPTEVCSDNGRCFRASLPLTISKTKKKEQCADLSFRRGGIRGEKKP